MSVRKLPPMSLLIVIALLVGVVLCVGGCSFFDAGTARVSWPSGKYSFVWSTHEASLVVREDMSVSCSFSNSDGWAASYGYAYGLSSSEIAQQEPAYKHEPVKLVGKRTKHDGQTIDISELDAGEYLIKSEFPGDLGRYSYLLVD